SPDPKRCPKRLANAGTQSDSLEKRSTWKICQLALRSLNDHRFAARPFRHYGSDVNGVDIDKAKSFESTIEIDQVKSFKSAFQEDGPASNIEVESIETRAGVESVKSVEAGEELHSRLPVQYTTNGLPTVAVRLQDQVTSVALLDTGATDVFVSVSLYNRLSRVSEDLRLGQNGKSVKLLDGGVMGIHGTLEGLKIGFGDQQRVVTAYIVDSSRDVRHR
ncbi:hypothetical protein FOZ63_015343, partial [Perkinsus olseni]